MGLGSPAASDASKTAKRAAWAAIGIAFGLLVIARSLKLPWLLLPGMALTLAGSWFVLVPRQVIAVRFLATLASSFLLLVIATSLGGAARDNLDRRAAARRTAEQEARLERAVAESVAKREQWARNLMKGDDTRVTACRALYFDCRPAGAEPFTLDCSYQPAPNQNRLIGGTAWTELDCGRVRQVLQGEADAKAKQDAADAAHATCVSLCQRIQKEEPRDSRERELDEVTYRAQKACIDQQRGSSGVVRTRMGAALLADAMVACQGAGKQACISSCESPSR
jgi:hypothetical protein